MRTIILSISICICSFGYAQSPYIHKVYDFRPAPGQYINELPDYEDNDTHNDLIRKVEGYIAGNQKTMISLGGYGGYVIFGFDHLVENRQGRYDFKIWGNAFYSNTNPNPDAALEGGSCEPGIVMVAYDLNQNGLPDDTWYELAGSEYHKPKTIHNYQITYDKPDPDKHPTPNKDYPYLNDTTYIKWNNNQGESGYVYKNTYHAQSYYPLWLANNQISFEGTKLANNSVDESGNGSYFVQYAYRWGYADNHPNNSDRSCFDISWAVDSEGNPVQLPGINFVKVYTAVNQYCGWLGEISTEIMGAEDLHLQKIDISVPAYTEGIRLNMSDLQLNIGDKAQLKATIFSSNPILESAEWTSSNDDCAVVSSDGTITAITAGTLKITATTQNGLFSDSCNVEVTTSTATAPDSNIAKSKVVYNHNSLRLINLDGYICSIITITGEVKETFTVVSTEETLPFQLPSGIYILKAHRNNNTQSFKLFIF